MGHFIADYGVHGDHRFNNDLKEQCKAVSAIFNILQENDLKFVSLYFKTIYLKNG